MDINSPFVYLFEMTAARGAELIMFIVSRGVCVWGGGILPRNYSKKEGLAWAPQKNERDCFLWYHPISMMMAIAFQLPI